MRLRIREREEVRPMTITAAAAAVGVSVTSLKQYESAGICVPARDTAGRRLYIPADIERIKQYRATHSRKK